MKVSDETAYKVAEYLLQIKAIKLQPDKPFIWASGIKSPIYCDNRKVLSYPPIRTYIRQKFAELILKNFGKPEVIAGVATGGIAIGALVAEEMGLPFVYVRNEPKKHGLTNMIEGVIEKGQKVLIIEDLISTGNSSLTALKALENEGCVVKGMYAIFTYGFKEATKNFLDAKCRLETLTDYNFLIETALKKEYISEKDLESLKEWRINPLIWK